MKSKAHGFCNRTRRLKRNRNGFSMVEIIIVIAVMGLLASSAFSLTNYLKYADVQKALKTIEDQINKLQVTSMSKKDKQEIRIYKVGNDTYLKVGPASMTLDNQTRISAGACCRQFCRRRISGDSYFHHKGEVSAFRYFQYGYECGENNGMRKEFHIYHKTFAEHRQGKGGIDGGAV